MTVLGVPGAIPPPVSPIDRSAADRDIPDALVVLTREPNARVLFLHRGRAPLGVDGSSVELVSAEGVACDAVVAFLGRDHDGPVLLASTDETDPEPFVPAGGWAELRDVGGALDTASGALFVEGLALDRWIRGAPFCPACGERSELRQAGWSRHCSACGREEFPRTDPAVIVAVTDGTRLLLGSNAAWPAGRYSCFAGFVEAGESAEAALVREIEEEAGVRLDALEYVGSQAWPYPRSLMLGYLASTTDASAARPDGSEIIEVRWFGADEIAAALAGDGDITLPGPSSISRGLIEQWLERVTATP